jgi:hypothetical protein
VKLGCQKVNDDGWKRTRYTEITLATWNVRGQDEGEDPGKDGEKWKEIFK